MWKQVIAPTIIVSLLWVTVSVISTFHIYWAYEFQSRALAESLTTIRSSGEIQDTLWRLYAVAREAGGKDHLDVQARTSELEAEFQRRLAEAERTSFSSEEQSLIETIRTNFAMYREQLRKQFQSRGRNGPQPLQVADQKESLRLVGAMTDACQQLVRVNERQLEQSTEQSNRIAGFVNMLRFAFLIAGPVVGVLCGLWVARGLHRSISQISITLEDATGAVDWDVGHVEVRASGDLPALQQQVQAVAARIRTVVDELQQARHQAMLTERLVAVGELAAGVAHELRNPLTSVKLLVQTAAQRQAGTGLQDRQLQVVQQEIARMESTIQGLLDFARPPRLHRVTHDVRETVRRALNLVAGRLQHQKVVVSEEFPSVPVVVDGDPEQLHQVFVNLLINGIEAVPEGGSLQVAIRGDAEVDGVCQIEFRDSGSGIPPEVLGRIFQPFVTSKERGTGLGLAVSRRIIEEHDGLLLAANQIHGGAVFTVRLPLKSCATREPATPTDRACSDAQTVHPPFIQTG